LLVAEGALLVDVRDARDYEQGHIEGALNIPLDQLNSRLAELPQDRAIITYCEHGMRSEQATATLCDLGYDVYTLGRMDSWPDASAAD
jgi:rhodanese-related sulfurtransferase